MMKNISLYFQVHQPFQLRTYRFFDIGTHSNYYAELENEFQIENAAKSCYLPANNILLDLIKKHGKDFKVTFSISGTTLEMLEEFQPAVLEGFKELAATGSVEFLAETYSHSLVSLRNQDDFKADVLKHADKIEETFGMRPKVFRNTELIYNNKIGQSIAELGFSAAITEGAKHILGWKSPNKIYYNSINPELKLLLRNYTLSDDISYRFSDHSWDQHPITAEKFVGWLKNTEVDDELINIFMNYETFGQHQGAETGIFDFLINLGDKIATDNDLKLTTPSEAVETLQPVASLNVEHTISWSDEERDITAWLGNDMQEDAFKTVAKIAEMMQTVTDAGFLKEWSRLKASNHFLYMSTKEKADGTPNKRFTPYKSPYDAFINYMNVLNDFGIRVNREFKSISPINKIKIQEEIDEYRNKIAELEEILAKPNAIENTKNEPVAISKTKAKAKIISKTKPKAKVISKTKKTAKAAISKTKKQPKAIPAHKETKKKK